MTDVKQELGSLFGNGAVLVDPWAVNGVADELMGSLAYDLAIRDDGPPPLMFSDGAADLPTFTASGIDPQMLLRMPYRTRHYLASCTDRGVVYELMERDCNDPWANYESEGLTNAINRVRNWATGASRPRVAEEISAEEYAAFGAALSQMQSSTPGRLATDTNAA